jgi:hypothetical protein
MHLTVPYYGTRSCVLVYSYLVHGSVGTFFFGIPDIQKWTSFGSTGSTKLVNRISNEFAKTNTGRKSKVKRTVRCGSCPCSEVLREYLVERIDQIPTKPVNIQVVPILPPIPLCKRGNPYIQISLIQISGKQTVIFSTSTVITNKAQFCPG